MGYFWAMLLFRYMILSVMDDDEDTTNRAHHNSGNADGQFL